MYLERMFTKEAFTLASLSEQFNINNHYDLFCIVIQSLVLLFALRGFFLTFFDNDSKTPSKVKAKDTKSMTGLGNIQSSSFVTYRNLTTNTNLDRNK